MPRDMGQGDKHLDITCFQADGGLINRLELIFYGLNFLGQAGEGFPLGKQLVVDSAERLLDDCGCDHFPLLGDSFDQSLAGCVDRLTGLLDER